MQGMPVEIREKVSGKCDNYGSRARVWLFTDAAAICFHDM